MGDPARDLCLRLAEDTFKRIRADRQRASVRVAQLLEVIEERLLDPDLDVQQMLRAAGQRDPNVSTQFSSELGLSPWAYVLEARMELAGRMLTSSKFEVWRIGTQVGYLSPGSFSRAFKKWSGKSPGKFRKAARSPAAEEPVPVPDEMVSRQAIRRAVAGQLPAEQAEMLAEQLFGLGKLVCASYQQMSQPEDGSMMVESTMARNLWRWIKDLPFEVQMRAVESQAPRYHTPALFNRLCTASVEAREPIRALELATLALASLQAIEDRLGEADFSIYARASAVVGYAQCGVGNLDEAERQLARAAQVLDQAGDEAHPVVVAELCFYQAALEVERENFEEARELSDEGTLILRLVADRLLERPLEDPTADAPDQNSR